MDKVLLIFHRTSGLTAAVIFASFLVNYLL